MSNFEDMYIFNEVFKQLHQSDDLQKRARFLYKDIRLSSDRIANNLSLQLVERSKYLTYSHSQTVEEVISMLLLPIVYCMRSLPGGEGETLANNIAGRLIDDGTGMKYIDHRRIDAILLGADKFTSDGYLVNKAGSQDLINQASEKNIPVFILSSKYKKVEKIEKVSSELLEIVELKSNCKIITENRIFFVEA